MKRTAGLLLAVFIGLAGAVSPAQSRLSTRDYDDFYSRVIPANTSIVNANAQSWDDLVADAQNYPKPGERLAVIMRNQMNGVASALSLLRASRPRSDAEMDYATAVIWRYTGHYAGRDGWEREPLIRIPYSELSEAEKVKDRIVWTAVRDALATR